MCQGCKLDFQDDELTIDHIRPKSKGGHRRALGNLQLMCWPCNHAKGDNWDGVSGVGVHDCNRKPMPINEQALNCLEAGFSTVAIAQMEARGRKSLPELIALGVAAAVATIPDGYVAHRELADAILAEGSSTEIFAREIEKNDPLFGE